MLLHQLWSW